MVTRVEAGRLRGDADADAAEVDDGATRQTRLIAPWGLRSRPPSGALAAVLSLASGEDVAMTFTPSPGDGLGVGDVALRSSHGSQIRCRDGLCESSDEFEAPGYRCNGLSGTSGTLTITASSFVLTLILAGGIIVSVTASGTAVWQPSGG